MLEFHPHPGEQLRINSTAYEVMPHPAVANIAYGQEGRKAIVYQLRTGQSVFALKIFKPAYRIPSLVEISQTLSKFRRIEGLEVCDRQCLTQTMIPGLLSEYPELEYAVLMPWIDGLTWFDIVFAKAEIDQRSAWRLAHHTVTALGFLESHDIAHCDVAGSNVIVRPHEGRVNLIDVEDACGDGLVLTHAFPMGTSGYQHRSVPREKYGQWCKEGDRFSAAILLSEMLVWYHPKIRQVAEEEHYFSCEEIHDPQSSNYKLMVEVLSEFSSELSGLLSQAWHSVSLQDCPPISEWAVAMGSAEFGRKLAREREENSGKMVGVTAQVACAKTLGHPIIQTLSSLLPVEEPFWLCWSTVPDAYSYELQEAKSHIYARMEYFETICETRTSEYECWCGERGERAYRVRAFTKNSEKGEWSPIHYVLIGWPPLTVPFLFKNPKVSKDGTFTIMWKPVSYVTEYLVEEKVINFGIVLRHEIYSIKPPSNQLSLIAKTGEIHEFRVQAKFGEELSEFSDPVRVKISDGPVSFP